MQLWKKLGRVYCPSGKNILFKTHAYQPTPIVLNDRIRIYFSSFDYKSMGRIRYIDVDKHNPTNYTYIHKSTIVDIGESGTFDCNGVSPSCIFYKDDKYYLYYFGWQRTESVPFMLYTGLATSSDGVNFEKYSRVPILDRIDKERFIRDASFVINYQDGYLMYYVTSPIKWGNYCVYYLESDSLYKWTGGGKVAIPLRNGEFGIGRPCVLFDNNIYKMWYGYRGHEFNYDIGYAESKDGKLWKRMDDEIEFTKGRTLWDSTMKCMPYVVKVDNDYYMFYNGDGIGRTGFGCAKLY